MATSSAGLAATGTPFVLWDETGNGVQVSLTAKIHLSGNDGQCTRVRMIGYDINGTERGDRQFGPADNEGRSALSATTTSPGRSSW